jgi:hypothetical protein
MTTLFQDIDHSQAVFMMGKTTRKNLIQHRLASVTKWGVPQVVAKGYGLGQHFVELKGFGDRSSDLCNLQGVRKTSAVMVSCGGEKYLSFVLKTSERFGVDNPISITLKHSANEARVLRFAPTFALGTQFSKCRKGRPFLILNALSNSHRCSHILEKKNLQNNFFYLRSVISLEP